MYIQNVAFALKERLALSCHLRGTSAEQSIAYLSPEVRGRAQHACTLPKLRVRDVAWWYQVCFRTLQSAALPGGPTGHGQDSSRAERHPCSLMDGASCLLDDGALQLPSPEALAAAASGVERLVAQRLRELMLLSDWPCVCARRTQLQLDRLYEQGERHGAFAGAVRSCSSSSSSSPQALPPAPPPASQRRDVTWWRWLSHGVARTRELQRVCALCLPALCVRARRR